MAARRRRRIPRRLRRLPLHVVFIASLLAAWQVASTSIFSPRLVSNPADVARQLVEWARDGTITHNLSFTLRALLLGFLIGAALAEVVAIAMSESPVLGRFLEPYIMAISAVPYTALAPIFIIWFGLDIAPKVVSGAMAAFFVMVINAFTGLRETDVHLLELARILRANRTQRLLKIKLPASLPFLFVGLRLALPRALIAVAVAEFLASSRGVGHLIVRSSNLLNTAGVFAGTILITSLVYALSGIVLLIERRALRWRPKERR